MKAPIKTLNQAILAAMETYAEKACFKINQGERYQSISYRQFEGLTFRMVRFLQSLDITGGERIAIAADNSLQWMIVYVATLLAGGVVAPLRSSLAPNSLRFMLEDLGASLVVLDNEHLIRTVSTSWLTENETHLPELKAILVANEAAETFPGTISIAGVLSEADPLMSEAHNAILKHADAPEISHFALVADTELTHLSDRELINFARQDGATVIDAQGKFKGCMVLLRPDANTQAEIGSGKGARHSSAAKISAETQCLAITVSQDGPITIYDNGRRVLSL